jgi:hypothetical protein
MSMPASDPAKMKSVRAWVVAAIVTWAGAAGGFAVRDHWWPSLSGRCQAIPDLPPARLTVGGDDPGVLELAQVRATRQKWS